MSGLLMVAPCLHHPELGGIQRCGHSAWQWLGNARQGSRLLTYGPDCHDGCNRSKWTVGLSAARYANWSDPVIVWHRSLLKLGCLTPRLRKLAVMLHGIEAWEKLKPAELTSFERVNLFCTVSDYTWHRFTAANPQFSDRHHEIVHLGFGDGPLPASQPDPAIPAAVIVARMNRDEDYKGHRQLIECWPLVQRRIPAARLWIVGDGDLEAELKELALRTSDAAHIQFLGRLPEAEKLTYIQRARCLAMPSRGEGFGLVYLEAMRAGRPCLVSNQDAGQEVVNPPEAGLAVDPVDPAACSEAIIRMLTDGRDWQQWSSNAQRRYSQHFTNAAFHRRLSSAIARLES